MTVVTELRSMMLPNVTRSVRNRKAVTLLISVEKEEDCINVASGKTMIDKDKMEEYFVGFLNKYLTYEVTFCFNFQLPNFQKEWIMAQECHQLLMAHQFS